MYSVLVVAISAMRTMIYVKHQWHSTYVLGAATVASRTEANTVVSRPAVFDLFDVMPLMTEVFSTSSFERRKFLRIVYLSVIHSARGERCLVNANKVDGVSHESCIGKVTRD